MRYYIVFSYKKGRVNGKNWYDISLNSEIENIEQIEEVTKMIKEDGGYDAVIIENWKRIGVE